MTFLVFLTLEEKPADAVTIERVAICALFGKFITNNILFLYISFLKTAGKPTF